MTRIVCLSDTHNQLDRIQVPDGDVLVHAGDATMSGSMREVAAFAAQYGALPHRYKLFVAGNHDWLFEQQRALAIRILADHGITYLEDECASLDGISLVFYGTPWQLWFNAWAFNLRNEQELGWKYDKIPDDVDVLIAHSPAYGIGDEVRATIVGTPGNVVNLGSHAMLAALDRVQPQLFVCGHIHDGYGLWEWERKTVVNASICTDEYKPTNAPIVVDL